MGKPDKETTDRTISSEQKAYDELQRYTLEHSGPEFIHQHVMSAPAGPERDKAIDSWCASVWDAFRESHRSVVELLQRHSIL
jgi:hypothetical protein